VFLARSAGRKDLVKHVVDVSLYSIFGGLVGARLWHVFVFNWDYYSQHLDQIISVPVAGLSIQGGLIGGVLVAVLYCRWKKINLWEILDICAPAMIFGQAVGRSANLLNGDGLGSPTGEDFGILYPPGTNAAYEYPGQPLWPAEIWEGQIDVIIFALLLVLRLRRWPSGYIFSFYVLMYSMNRFGMEFLRGDTPDWAGLSAAQWTCVGAAVLALVFLVLRRKAPQGLGFGTQGDGKGPLSKGKKRGGGKNRAGERNEVGGKNEAGGKDEDRGGKDKAGGKDEDRGKDEAG